MADLIKLLPDSVANQIAAGEVIQRPSSVVKELVENAVDAGSANIKVLIKDSGKTLIQVIDDGSGMSETDARLSFERHATSKITSAHDLFAITTKGFRGEALASIAAVAMVELRTRKEEEESGTLIVINGSKIETQEPCSCPKGSSFAVKNLFFNIPARRKFLKSDNTEMRHIVGEFQKIVLSHPGIRFSLYHNDTEVYNLPPSNLRQRIVSVFGRQINQELININTETSLIRLGGFIGKPESARRTFGEQFFFVNNRFMKHTYFHKAVSEAYQNILPADAIPSYFIYMETDPASIDINIHPTKTEIKFEDERSIWQILMASVREALGRFNIVPSIDFRNEALIDIPVQGRGSELPEAPKIQVDPAYDPFKGEAAAWPFSSSFSHFESSSNRHWERLFPLSSKEEGLASANTYNAEAQRRFFQVRNKYIVCPVKSGLMVIDQKRAHERILFERYLDILGSGTLASQTDMFPATLTLDQADLITLKDINNELSLLGFRLDFDDKGTVTVKGRPAGTEGNDPSEIIEILIEEYKSTQADPLTGAREKVALSLAGAAAIPYGKVLPQQEMEELFDTLFACKSPNYSPTGKSIINIFTLEEIDKRFN